MALIAVYAILAVLALLQPISSDETLCDKIQPIAIPNDKFFGEKWYLQSMQFYPIPFQCLISTFDNNGVDNDGKLHGTLSPLNNNSIIENYDADFTMDYSNGTRMYFPTMLNLVFQFLEFDESSQSFAAILCNKKENISIFVLFTKKREVFPKLLASIKDRLINRYPNAGIQILSNDVVNQDNCSN